MSFVVTIDGPGAAGKSTTARAVAVRLGFLYLDTGALYRALAYKALDRGVAPDDDDAIEELASGTQLDLSAMPDGAHVWLDGADVSGLIRTPAVSEVASRLAARPAVRRALVEIQRALGTRGPVVAEGRDLGTVVYPHAEVKIFLDASPAARARRRYQELRARGIAASLEEVQQDLDRRDTRDRERSEGPLRPAEGAVVIDTTDLSPAAQIDAILEVVRSHPGFPKPDLV